MPETPIRSVRVPDDLWKLAREEAESRDETVTDPIVRALTRYTQHRRAAQQRTANRLSVASDTLNTNPNGDSAP